MGTSITSTSAFFIALFFLCFNPNSALKCYNSSFSEVENFMSLSPPEVIDCGGFCVSQYQNDGQTTNYTLRCDDSTKHCSVTGCTDDIGSSTKTCCCNDKDLCVHPNATMPIVYDLNAISFSSATAAYQVEGGAFDHRGPSIWDLYVRRPGTIKNNDTGDDACKSYYYWKDDIALLKSMNVKQYRFSISWSRIFLDGTNATINPIGIQYYSDLIDGLLAAGIEPVVTMYHWDLPQRFMDVGGWLNEKTAIAFGEYTRFVFQQFSDRVTKWIPINEPLSVVQFEYCGDTHADAPGEFIAHCAWSLYLASKNMLLGHLEAWKAFQDLGLDKKGGQLGIALSGPWFFPQDYKNPDDQEASLRAFDFYWGLFAHPIFGANGDWAPRISASILDLSMNHENRTGSRLPSFTAAQISALKGSAQFIGVNYYNAAMVTSRTDDEISNRWDHNLNQEDYDGRMKMWPSPEWRQMNASNGWIYYTPFGLRNLLNHLHKEYNVPVLITENGCMDNFGEELQDVSRVHYLRGHLMAIAQSVQDGVKVLGHTIWSLMDNFEWLDGYSTKFGVHQVDFNDPNRTRTPKLSAGFYASVAASKQLTGFSINQWH